MTVHCLRQETLIQKLKIFHWPHFPSRNLIPSSSSPISSQIQNLIGYPAIPHLSNITIFPKLLPWSNLPLNHQHLLLRDPLYFRTSTIQTEPPLISIFICVRGSERKKRKKEENSNRKKERKRLGLEVCFCWSLGMFAILIQVCNSWMLKNLDFCSMFDYTF